MEAQVEEVMTEKERLACLEVVKEIFPLPHGLLWGIAFRVMEEHEEGDDLWKKAWRLGEICQLYEHGFSIPPYKEEVKALVDELLWDIQYFDLSGFPAWPDGDEYERFGLA